MGNPSDADIAPVAALIADPTRAAILTALLGGRALAAGELAPGGRGERGHRQRPPGPAARRRAGRRGAAGPSPLLPAGRARGRGGAGGAGQGERAAARAVAAAVAAGPAAGGGAHLLRPPGRAGRRGAAGRAARAGLPGRRAGHPGGERLLAELGVDVARARRAKRRFAPECLDWTERRAHLGGALGAAVTAVLLERGWYRRGSLPRAVVLTGEGREGLAALFSGKELTSHSPVT
ncbi:hypothetical protein ACFSTC_19015 [Nonomuraea ferruginea]